MDRICIGNGALFQFRYPLMKFKAKQLEFDLVSANTDIDADEMDRQIEIHFEQEGVTKDINQLVCDEYPEDMIK